MDAHPAACTENIRGRFSPIHPRLHLVESLPHADEACASASGIEDHVRELPAQCSASS